MACLIDGEVYSSTVVTAVIRSGKALISGLKDEQVAKELSDRLNKK